MHFHAPKIHAPGIPAKAHVPRPPMRPRVPRAPNGPNPLWGKNPNPRHPMAPRPRMTFAGLGAVDWGGIIGTAASVYTGQPNALSQPKPPPVAAPVQYGPMPGPSAPAQILTPVSDPWYKKPVVLIPAAGAVALLGWFLVSGRARKLSRR